MKWKWWLIIIGLVGVYLLLAYKNPFADSSLIPNLEPYPDTLLYSFPPWNWVRGRGWDLAVSGKVVSSQVPRTYGYFLVPFFIIFNDIRSFYIANIVLGIGSIVIFVLALRNILDKDSCFLSGYIGFLFVTNFYFFNQAQLVMTENLNYLLVVLFLYLCSLKFKWVHLVSMVLFVVMTAIVKSTNLVLAGSFAMSFLLKIFFEKLHFSNIKKLAVIIFIFVSAMLVFYLPKILVLSKSIFNLSFFKGNSSFYISCLSGGECRNLWYWQRMVSWDVFFMFVIGCVVMLFMRSIRWRLVEVVLPFILFVVAMSVFRDTEGRQVEILVPIMLMVTALILNVLLARVKRPIIWLSLLVFVNLFLTSYQPNVWEIKAVSLKKQVGLNFRHREDPWNYLCLKMIQNFMIGKSDSYFGSFLPIFFFDAYGSNFNYLPLSDTQDFMPEGRGLREYFPLPLNDIYIKKLKEGKTIYLSDYYASNGRDAWRFQWNDIVSGKRLEKVFQSPLDNCNIYKLSLNKSAK